MRQYEKIKIIFNHENSTILSNFWYSIDLSDKKEEEKYLYFIQKLKSSLEKNEVVLHRKVLASLKPFIKICKVNEKHNKKIKNITRNFSPLNKKKNKKIKNINKDISKTILIKYKSKIIYIYPLNYKKYTYVVNQIARANYFNFLKEFVENWNKYQSEFKININSEEINKMCEFENKKYIDYFENYYDNLE